MIEPIDFNVKIDLRYYDAFMLMSRQDFRTPRGQLEWLITQEQNRRTRPPSSSTRGQSTQRRRQSDEHR